MNPTTALAIAAVQLLAVSSVYGAITDVRLAGSAANRLEGNVEVQIDGSQWVKVCDNGWGVQDAAVTCRQLGGAGGQHTRRNFFNSPDNNIPFDVHRMRCEDDDESLEDCRKSFGVGRECENGHEAGVICDGVQHPVRLSGGSSDRDGVVEMQVGSAWRPACSKRFSRRNANVVCAQLGYGSVTDISTATDAYISDEPHLTFFCKRDVSELFDCLKMFNRNPCPEGAVAVTCGDGGDAQDV